MAKPLFRTKEELVAVGYALVNYPCFALGVFMLLSGIAIGVWAFVDPSPTLGNASSRIAIAGVLSLPVTALSLFLVWLSWPQLGLWVEIGKDGVRWRHLLWSGWWPWGEVATLWEDGTLSYEEGGGGVSWFTLVHRSGPRLKLRPDLMTNTRDLMARLRKHYTDAKLPAARAAFDAGKSVPFGPVELRPDGIAAAAGVLSWPDFGGVEVITGGRLVIRRAGQPEEWFGCPMRRVPDAPVLFALLVELLLRRVPDAHARAFGRAADGITPPD